MAVVVVFCCLAPACASSVTGAWRVVVPVSCVADGKYPAAPDLPRVLAARLAADFRGAPRVWMVQAGKSLWWVQEGASALEGRLSGGRMTFEVSEDVLTVGALRIAVSSRMQGRLEGAGQVAMEKDVDLQVTGAERAGAFGVVCRFRFEKTD